MISINDNKGFSMTFENGWTVSVQLGVMNYCANRTLESVSHLSMQEKTKYFSSSKPSPNAEIAAFKGDEWYDFWCGDTSASSGDTVKGWCKPDEILEFMNMIKNK